MIVFSVILAIECFESLSNKAITGKWDMTLNGPVDLCTVTCQKLANCSAITYTSTFSQTCTLWSEIDAITEIENVTVLRKKESVECHPVDKSCSDCQYTSTKGFSSSSTAYKSVSDTKECVDLCSSMDNCKAYSLNARRTNFQDGCVLYLNNLTASTTGPSVLMKKENCACADSSAIVPPDHEISQLEILGLALVAIFGVVALSGVIYVILYSYKPMKKSIPRWHATNSPTTPVNHAFSDECPLKEDKRESVQELRSLNIESVEESGLSGKNSFRLSLPNGYVKLSDFNGKSCQ